MLNVILLSVITLSIIILSVISISKNAYRTPFLDLALFIFYSMVTWMGSDGATAFGIMTLSITEQMPTCWMYLCWVSWFIYCYAECNFVEWDYTKYIIMSVMTRKNNRKYFKKWLLNTILVFGFVYLLFCGCLNEF
jgi:hypothetical protein